MQSTNTIDQLLDKMWQDYIKLNPMAKRIADLFESKGEKLMNDHIALRTFNHPKVSIDVLAKPFLNSGYKEAGEYHFEEKKLFAKHFEHPDTNRPKIFISELLLEKFSSNLQEKVSEIIQSIPDDKVSEFDFTCSGKSWNISSADYLKLREESEYAAWLSAIGYRPNHFTVFVNELNSFKELDDLNSFLKDNGFKLNDSGGEIKGSPEVFLEQSSTIADTVKVQFSDKEMEIPSCYYEFAKRYPKNNGEIYQGFVAKSADKIFESTNRSQ